jgi:putative lipoic acid-binding regulatory protein
MLNKDPCIHRWKYYKVVKQQPEDFIDNVTRVCQRCMLQEYVRRLRPHECTKIGTFKI